MERKASSSSTTPSVKAMRDFYAPWVTRDRQGRGIVKGGAAVKVSIPSASVASSSHPICGRGAAPRASRPGCPLNVRITRAVSTCSSKDKTGIAILSPAVTNISSTSSLAFSGGKDKVTSTSTGQVVIVNEGSRRPMPQRQIYHLPSRPFFDGDDSVGSQERVQWWRKGLDSFTGVLERNTATRPRQAPVMGACTHPSDSYRHHRHLPPRSRLRWARRVVAAIKAMTLIVTVAELGGVVSLFVFMIVVILFAKHPQQNDHEGRSWGADKTATSTVVAGGTNDETTITSMIRATAVVFAKPMYTHSLHITVFSSRYSIDITHSDRPIIGLSKHHSTWDHKNSRCDGYGQPSPATTSRVHPHAVDHTYNNPTSRDSSPPQLRPPESPPLRSSEASADSVASVPFGVSRPLRSSSTLRDLDHEETTVITVAPTTTTPVSSAGFFPPLLPSYLLYRPGKSV